ncbi:hypothetical protein NKH75_01605 [Mesorhizobium sp. M0984]|uniref:hypothetical protein n=1 Tax=Mesorhizobium sp. M0984 TaxID=2957041 RepID=UPI003338854A
MADAKSPEEVESEICEIVGRVVLSASLLDNQINSVLIAVLSLEDKALTFAVVAAHDAVRKIEILKAFAAQIPKDEWRKPLVRYLEGVEKINQARNTAAHSMVIEQGDDYVLVSNNAAKLLKATDKKTRAITRVPLGTLKDASERAKRLYKEGQTVLENFVRFQEERKKRSSNTDVKSR